jgi:aspartate aminotransferase
MRFADNLEKLGTESAFSVLARAQAMSAKGHDVINLGIGQPDFPTPPHIVEAGVKALRDGHHGYTPANGLPALREAVAADLLHRHGSNISPDNIMIMPGGKPTMFFAVLMFSGIGREILFPDPGFPIYESVIRYSGATPVPVKLYEADGFAFRAETVLEQITPRTSLIILNSPANPTGGVTSKAEVDKLVAGLMDHPHVTVLSDEIYSQMLYDGEQHASLLQYPEIRDRLIVLDGWSKTYAMTGWRLGFSVWPTAAIDHATRLAINCHSCVNASAQFAGLAALTGPQDAVRDMVAEFDTRRRIIVDGLNALPGVSCTTPRGAFYAFANITRSGLSAAQVQDLLLEKAGVATIAGTSFGAMGEGFIRLSYANSADNIRTALARMSQTLEEPL